MHEAPGRPALDIINDCLDVDGADFWKVFDAHVRFTREVHAKYAREMGNQLFTDWEAVDIEQEKLATELAAFEAGGRGV